MPETNRPLRVFLCHAKEDKPIVRELYRQLIAEGWMDIWLDEVNLLPGQEWDMEIEKAVEQADVVLVCLSTHSVDKEGYVQKELRFTLNIADEKPEGTIFVIPLRLDECQVPRRLRSWQWVDYFPKNNRKWAYQRLLESLKLRAAKLGLSIGKPISESTPVLPKPAPTKIVEKPLDGKKSSADLDSGEQSKGAKIFVDLDGSVGSQGSLVRKLESLEKKPEIESEPKNISVPTKEPQQKVKTPALKINARIGFIIGGFVFLIICWLAVNYLVNNFPAVAPNATSTSQTATETLIPFSTDTPEPSISVFTSETPTDTPEPSMPTFTPEPPTVIPSPTLGIGSTMISSKDGMTLVYVPSGEFTMGSDTGASDEKPVHTVYLDAFWIDQTEVTNAMYAKCVKDGKCDPPNSTGSYTHHSYYEYPEFDNYPVIYVSWNDANKYCSWADRRLPTEAEWEKAARGTDGNIYPWGNDTPKNILLNYNRAVGDTTEVGKYPDGKSIFGALDMAGNVWEWVSDWYNGNYYSNSPSTNPQGTNSGEYRALRGGAWDNGDNLVRSAVRNWLYPSAADSGLGFRCARSP